MNNMRYQILSNYLNVEKGFCYYLMDTETKSSYPENQKFPESKGYKIVEWSYNGAELHEKCKKLNLTF